MSIERKVWFQAVGSAILVSVACLDPGNLLGDIQAAQDMHYKTIWVVLVSHILLYFVQEMAFIVSVRSGTDLSNLIRLNYSRKISIFIWITQEIAIISADIQEVVGAVIALKLLFGLQEKIGIPVVLLIVIGILFLQELGQKIFEFGFLILIGLMGICFFVNFTLSNPPFGDIARGFIIDFPRSWTFTAVIGSIIMPQNVFLHSSLVQTRKHLDLTGKQFVTIFRVETIIILIVSFLINFSLVCVFANKKFDGIEITLENAGEYLTQFLKQYSGVLWSLGLFASGVSSTATGALTGQYLMDGIFNFNFNRRIRVLITRMIVIVPCYIIVGSFNVNTIVNLLNLVQIVSLPFVIIPLIKFSQNQPLLDFYRYSKCKFWTVVILFVFLMTINYVSMFDIIREFGTVGFLFGIAGMIVYTLFCFFLIRLQIEGLNDNQIMDKSASNIDEQNTKLIS